MGVVIRSYEDGDFDAVVSLEQGRKRNRYGAAVFIRQSAALYPHTFLVAEGEEMIVGYTVAAEVQDDAATAWILRLNVAPQWQGQGIGTTLIYRLFSQLDTRQVRRILLSVEPKNIPAKKIYERHGFVKIAYQSGYFCEGENRNIMQYQVES
jgi:ribosomal protein S18 acetylase RimI-like enzyme